MSEQVIAAAPLVLFVVLVAWGVLMKKACRFRVPRDPRWPFAENPGLALELADSTEFVDAVLGKVETELGSANRKAALLLQKLDFVFIPLYTLFLAIAGLQRGGWSRAWPAVGSALLAASLDVVEDVQILRMVKRVPGSSAKRFGQMKWLFYFATLGAEGFLFFFVSPSSTPRVVSGMALGMLLIVTAVGGIISALKGSFTGISSATKLSMLGLIGLALAPLIVLLPFSLRVGAEYAVLARVPLLLGVFLFSLPFIAFLTGARTLLRGLFDLTPPSLFVVTLTSLGAAGTACMTAYIVLRDGYERYCVPTVPITSLPDSWDWLLIMVFLSLPVIASSVWFSARQGHGLTRSIIAALAGTALAIGVALGLINFGAELATEFLPFLSNSRVENWLANTHLFSGYVQSGLNHDPWADHLRAFATFLSTLVLYVIVGIYGRSQLGKNRTVPALCSALMLTIMLGWMLSAVAFFFDVWRIPTLLIVAALGVLTAQSTRSDHFYHLRERESDSAAPDPVVTITATNVPRSIVVAANGGGIQASAWAAQVLYGLYEDCGERFLRSVRLISSVSGGSVGSATFVHWLNSKKNARQPDEAAAMSSLDEVAWGFSFTDFLRGLVPWVFGGLIGRGRALEQAWRLNSARDLTVLGEMDEPLSSWNSKVATGELPAVIMNATIAETGERLLLATTKVGRRQVLGRARVDATELHFINGEKLDVGVVTAARLSASFPYVTPAARSDAPGPQPHVVDGGYYDNYGMATMVEWLDGALDGAGDKVQSVLVVQIHGAPVNPDPSDERHAKKRGWFYQAIAPLTTLAAVRSAGQIAHNDIELELLQQKWAAAKVPIHTVTFEFQNPEAPLSWHLTPEDVRNVRSAWRDDMEQCRALVKEFLEGNDGLNCGCPRCNQAR